MNIEQSMISEENHENTPHPIRKFWDNHKTGILIGASAVIVIGGGILATAIGIKKYRESDIGWHIKNASLDELKEAIELAQAEYLNYTVNDGYREDLSKGIKLMNNRIRELDWVGVLPSKSTNHREHGNNLYKPD